MSYALVSRLPRVILGDLTVCNLWRFAADDGREEGGGAAAARERARSLRAYLRRERMTIALVLAEKRHHSA